MSKVQPNFSWQKYVGEEEDQKNQFQYQLQQEHIVNANAINATIDDESHWTRERQTSFTWVDGRPIWTKTILSTISTAPGVTIIPNGITGIRRVVGFTAIAEDAEPITTTSFTLPFLELLTPANSVEIYFNPSQIVIVTLSAAWLNYLVSITIQYTK